MKKILLMPLLLIFYSLSVLGQDDSSDLPEYRRIEGIMNISNALSRFAGNTVRQNVFEEPFLIGVKISNKTKTYALRVGINFNYTNTNEDLGTIARSTKTNSLSPLLGIEWRMDLGYNFEFYGGIDARYYYDVSNTVTQTFSSSGTTLKNDFFTLQEGFGAGPFCGFMYNLTPRICFLTEANFYVNYIHTLRKFSNDGVNFETFENRSTYNVSPSAPSSVCLLIKF